ncbi:hypothetical protein [Sphaerisporangium aureirubrum]|uniref:Lantibiotic dehydratase n=1 Tax=Sphaerisporangium aureirubrum TaxID=1544736 RepID=A0ABW1NAP5_9ACTN
MNTTVAPARARPSPWARFGTWLSSLLRRVRKPITEEVDDQPFEFWTPALHDGFPFHVSIRLSWQVKGAGARRALREAVGERREAFRQRLEDAVRPVARLRAPHEPHLAEKEINELIKGMRLFEEDEKVQFACTATSRVTPAWPIVQQQQKLWLSRVAQEEMHRRAVLAVGRMRESREAWRSFLSEGMDDWITPYAVRLAESHEDVAGTVTEMLDYRRNEASDLIALVSQIMSAHQSTNVYDFVVSSETVLRNTLTMMGIPMPDPPPDSLFSPSGTVRGSD